MKGLFIASRAGFGVVLTGLTLCVFGVSTVCAQEAASSVSKAPQAGKVMREFRGIKLGLKPEAVRSALGKAESTSAERDEFKISDDELLTIHYDNGAVKAIQLYITDPKSAPAFEEVVGAAEVVQNENGARSARLVMREENFWVSMYQNKDKTVTTITISR